MDQIASPHVHPKAKRSCEPQKQSLSPSRPQAVRGADRTGTLESKKKKIERAEGGDLESQFPESGTNNIMGDFGRHSNRCAIPSPYFGSWVSMAKIDPSPIAALKRLLAGSDTFALRLHSLASLMHIEKRATPTVSCLHAIKVMNQLC